jgi:putative FmdB family regulatory protein
MPLYEYICRHCDTQFERLRTIAEGAAADCPQCGAQAPRILSLMAAPVRVGAGVGPSPMGPMSGGACCGGGCGCH